MVHHVMNNIIELAKLTERQRYYPIWTNNQQELKMVPPIKGKVDHFPRSARKQKSGRVQCTF